MRRAVAIDLGGTNLRAAVVREDGEILERHQRPTPADAGPAAVLAVIAELVAECERGHRRGAGDVGLGFPGFLYPDGHVYHAPNLSGWDGFALKQELSKTLARTAYVENDANAAAVGEWRYGAAQGARHFAQLTIGTGLGGGLILEGALYRGANGMAGEVGHIPVGSEFVCGCGKQGCLETVVSLQGLRNLSGNPTLDPVAAAAGKDPVFEQMGRYLGHALAFLGNTLNLERVVVGGGISAAFDLFIGAARESFAQQALPAIVENMDVVRSALDDAGTLGAAALCFDD